VTSFKALGLKDGVGVEGGMLMGEVEVTLFIQIVDNPTIPPPQEVATPPGLD